MEKRTQTQKTCALTVSVEVRDDPLRVPGHEQLGAILVQNGAVGLRSVRLKVCC